MNILQKKMIELAYQCIAAQKYSYLKMLILKLLETGFNNSEILSEISKIYTTIRQNEKALRYARRAFELEKSVDSLEALANACFACKEYQDAAIFFEELTKYKPEIRNYIACQKSYAQLGLEEEGIRVLEEALKKHSTPEIMATIIHEYLILGMEDKCNYWVKIIQEEFPNKAATEHILGLYYEAQTNDYEEAKKHYLKGAKLGNMNIYYDLGVCHKHCEEFDLAEKYFKKMNTSKKSIDVDYNYSLATIYLAQRKMKHGFKYYENRSTRNAIPEQIKKRYWDGKDYLKETILVESEQGFGDNIQFSRFLPLVAKKFKHVYFSVEKPLYNLMKESFKKYKNIEVISKKLVKYDKFVLIMDIQNLLNISYHNMPEQKPYLITDKEKDYAFKIKHFRGDDLKIGLYWRAKGMGLRDAVYRTIDAPYYFKRLFDLPNTKFYSFQMNDIFDMCEKYPQIVDLEPDIENFDDTASMLKNIDVLITVDTALAHLAGALGIKTYLLLCFAPDWRWFDNDKRTEWYPNVTIIKQHDRRTWKDVADSLYNYISEECKKKH